MLECLVFGRRAAEDINGGAAERPGAAELPRVPARDAAGADLAGARRRIQDLMSEHGHVIRTESGLEYALGEVRRINGGLSRAYSPDTRYLETLNVAAVAEAILSAALARRDSVGSHYVEKEGTQL
jgi:L-aspartate oxidase